MKILPDKKYDNPKQMGNNNRGYNQAIDEIAPKLQAAIDKACDVEGLVVVLNEYIKSAIGKSMVSNRKIAKAISAHVRACLEGEK